MMTWCYPLKKRVTYGYSAARRMMEKAFTTNEVAKMLNHTRHNLEMQIVRGNIEPPQFTYGLNENMRKFKYMWDEKHIMDAHAYYLTVHIGRTRKDGLITPKKMPTARELRAIIRQEEVLYVKDGDEFKPTWRAHDF